MIMNDTNKKTTIQNADAACQENHFQKACRKFRELEWDAGRGTTDSSFKVLEYCWKHKEVNR